MLELLLVGTEKIITGYTYSLVELADRPIASSHNAVALLNGKLYVAGGLTNPTVAVNNFNIYDIATNTWSTGPVLPATERGGAMGAFGNYVIYIGGYDQGNTNAYTATSRVYNVANNTWQTGGTALNTASSDLCAAQHPNGKLYIFGGYQSGGILNAALTMDVSLAPSLAKAGLATPANLRFAGTLLDGNYIYFCGGLSTSGTFVNVFKRYNISTNTYETLANFPTTSHSVNLIRWGNKIFAYTAYNNGAYANRLYAYDLTAGTWEDIGDITGQLHGTTCGIVYNSELYLIGGYNGTSRHAKVSKLTRTPIYA